MPLVELAAAVTAERLAELRLRAERVIAGQQSGVYKKADLAHDLIEVLDLLAGEREYNELRPHFLVAVVLDGDDDPSAATAEAQVQLAAALGQMIEDGTIRAYTLGVQP